MLLQLERAGLKVEVDPQRIQECSTAIRRSVAKTPSAAERTLT
jgi:hypothetical protein